LQAGRSTALDKEYIPTKCVRVLYSDVLGSAYFKANSGGSLAINMMGGIWGESLDIKKQYKSIS